MDVKTDRASEEEAAKAPIVYLDQKKRLLSTVFTEITMHDRALETATPHPDWTRYIEEAIASANCGQRGNRTPTAKGG